MFSKVTLLSTLIGAIVFNLLGYVIFAILLAERLQLGSTQNDWTLLIIASIIFAYVVSILYQKQNTEAGFKSGLGFGFWIGILFSGAEGLLMASSGAIDLTQWLYYLVGGLVFYSLLGGSIGWAVNKFS